jgi:hypothetical protein
MNWWKRIFGLDPIDLAVHATVTGLAAGMMGEASGNDALIMLTLAIGTGLYAWRRQRVLRALPGAPPGDYERARMEDLEARVAELEAAQDRVLELEERLDFTERMLARGGEPAALPREPGADR